MDDKLGNKTQPHEQILELLSNKDEITWQTILYELVKSEEMDPWNVDISLLTRQYIGVIKKLKELDFGLSGKVLLAAAILLRIKSNRLIGRDLTELDRLFAEPSEEEEFYDDLLAEQSGAIQLEKPSLIPRTPQPRKRNVSIYDLVGALEKALEVKRRRVLRSIPENSLEIPEKTADITDIIKQLYINIKKFFSMGHKRLTFAKLVPSEKKEDKVLTFIPLLHLATPPNKRIDLLQEEHFGEIEIILKARKELETELGTSKTI